MRELSTRIIEEIARREGVDPVDLRPPLYEVIDPEALDGLFPDPGPGREPNGIVDFRYRGYLVHVESSGQVSVTEEQVAESG